MTIRIRLGLLATTLGVSWALVGCGEQHNDHTVAGARGGVARAQLDVQSGASSITVDSVSLGADFYRVSTPASAGLRPVVHADNGQLRVSLTGPGGGPSSLRIDLSSAVVWKLRFDGGASDLVVDFSSGKLAGAELAAGDSRAALTLPRPSGTVRIAEQGGVSQLKVRVAGTAPVQLTASGGAAHVTLDGVTHTGVAGGSVFTTPGWSAASDRYDLLAHGGVSSVTIGRP